MQFYTAPPGYAENFSVIVLSATSVTLSWDEPSPEQKNEIIIGYIIYFLSLEDYSNFNFTSTFTSLTVTTLKPYHTYVCFIAAQTEAGTGPFGNHLFFRMPEACNITCVLKINCT